MGRGPVLGEGCVMWEEDDGGRGYCVLWMGFACFCEMKKREGSLVFRFL